MELYSTGGSGSTCHRPGSRRTGCYNTLQHRSCVQLHPEPHRQGNWRLLIVNQMMHKKRKKRLDACDKYDVCVFLSHLSGVTASLVLQSALEPLPGFSSSLLTIYVPVVLRDGASGLTNTGTVTVTICPCLQGGMQTEDRGQQRDPRWERHMVCLPALSASPSLIFSLVTLLAMLACISTMLGKVRQFL